MTTLFVSVLAVSWPTGLPPMITVRRSVCASAPAGVSRQSAHAATTDQARVTASPQLLQNGLLIGEDLPLVGDHLLLVGQDLRLIGEDRLLIPRGRISCHESSLPPFRRLRR